MIYLKKQFYSYKIEENKSTEKNVDMFLKLIADLESLKVNITDEDQVIHVFQPVMRHWFTLFNMGQAERLLQCKRLLPWHIQKKTNSDKMLTKQEEVNI